MSKQPSRLSILFNLEMLNMGIVPATDAQDLVKSLDTLPENEKRKVTRKWRKLWRKQAKREVRKALKKKNSSMKEVEFVLDRYGFKTSQAPNHINKTERRMSVLGSVVKKIK